MKIRQFLQRALTDLLRMTPWPLEAAGSWMLWHYGSLFSSNQVLSRDYRGIISRIMPNDAWGIFSCALGYALATTCAFTWLARKRFYVWRIVLASGGLLVWGVLCYSCWRADVPFVIWRLYASFWVTQAFVAMLIRARHLGEKDDLPQGEGGTHGLV